MKLRPRTKGLSRILSLGVGPGLTSLLFLLLALGLFLVSAVRPNGMQGLRTGTTDLIAPVLDVIGRPFNAASDYVRSVSGLKTLQAENARLQDENARLRDWYQSAQVLQSENESLRRLMHVNLAPDKTFVTAHVVADSGNAYVKTVLVMAGVPDGVAKGQAVLGPDGMIGRIVEAGNKASRVLLLTDINSRVPVIIEGTDINAILAGDNDDLPQLIHLPSGSSILSGQRIITSGRGGFFPYGLPVGETVKLPDGQWAVRPFADSERASFVRIVNGGDDPGLHDGNLP